MSATVNEVMTTRVVAVTKDASFRDIAGLLRQHRVIAFPVVDADRKVIGVVSEADMLPKEALLAGFGNQPPAGAVAEPHNDFAKAAGVTAASIVTLEGRPQTAQQGRNILAQVWHVEGVVSVRDRLTYPEERSSYPEERSSYPEERSSSHV